jgi:hypothetical protein
MRLHFSITNEGRFFGNKITNTTSICSAVEIWRDAFVYCVMKTDQYAQVVYDNIIGHKFFTIGTGVQKNYNNFTMRTFNAFR